MRDPIIEEIRNIKNKLKKNVRMIGIHFKNISLRYMPLIKLKRSPANQGKY